MLADRIVYKEWHWKFIHHASNHFKAEAKQTLLKIDIRDFYARLNTPAAYDLLFTEFTGISIIPVNWDKRVII